MNERNEVKVINLLKTYHVTDLHFIKGDAGKVELVYQIDPQFNIYQISILQSELNFLQLAVLFNLPSVVKHIFEEHKIISISKAAKNIDPRYMTINARDEETFTLRLALQDNNQDLFFYLWDQEFSNNSEQWTPLFTEDNLRVIVEFAVYKLDNNDNFFSRFLNSQMTQRILMNTQGDYANEILDRIRGKSNVNSILSRHPYNRISNSQDDNVTQMY